MKIINRRQFLDLPKGILYAKFDPYIFGDIHIKEESLSNDWYYQDFLELDVNDSEEWHEKVGEAMEKGISLQMDYDCISRDGFYDEPQLFAVFEKKDVEQLVKRLNETITTYPEI